MNEPEPHDDAASTAVEPPYTIVEAIPRDDPQQVRELSPRVLDCFHVAEGHNELAGCTLEPRPLLRLTLNGGGESVRQLWFGGDGQPLERELIARLGLETLSDCERRLRASDHAMVRQWIRIALEGLPGEPSEAALVEAMIVWCRWASGTIAFRFRSGASARTTFAGWAADFVSGRYCPEKFHCEESGAESYHVLALDDGTVTVPAAVASCQASGTVTLEQRLQSCELSGQRVLPEQLRECPISGKKAVRAQLQACQWCERLVEPAQIHQQRCGDCRHGQPIDGDDPLLLQLRAQHPELRGYGHWQGWRDGHTAVLAGSRMWGKLALICDMPSGQIRKRARWGRLKQRWQLEP